MEEVECKVLDTDLLVDFLRGKRRAVQYIEEQLAQRASLRTTAVNLFELFYGAYRAGSDEGVEAVKKLASRMEILVVDERVAEEAGEELAYLVAQGLPIDIRDLLIGVAARINGCSVVTSNEKHFRRVRGLKVESWRR